MADSRKMTAEPAQDERYELPPGWRWARISDVVQSVGQFNPAAAPEAVYRYVDVSSISNRRFEIDAPKIVTGAEAPTRARQAIQPGDVLFSTVRPYLRNVALIRKETDGDVGSTAFCVLRSNGFVEPGYLFRWTLTKEFFEDLLPKQRGISYPAVRDADVLGQAIPLAPLPEQRRIVAKIEAVFEQSRTARQALDRIPSLLKKFRQSVLAAAFRGDLTRDWREQNPDVEPASVLFERTRTTRRHKWEQDIRAKGKDPRKVKHRESNLVDTGGLPELPRGWLWVPFGDAVSSMKNGIYKPADVYGDGVPCLRMYNIASGGIVWKDIKLMRLSTAEVDEYRLLPDDILLNRVNSRELVGKAAVIPQGLGDLVFESKNIRVRVRSGIVEPHYLSYYLLTNQCRKQIELRCKQTVGMATVSQSDIASWLFPFAPFEEQRGIVTKIGAMFAQADAIEGAVEATRRRSEKLEQSILARAFRGELVPQDPNDEPASVLLDRIRAERPRSNTIQKSLASSPREKKRQGRKGTANM